MTVKISDQSVKSITATKKQFDADQLLTTPELMKFPKPIGDVLRFLTVETKGMSGRNVNLDEIDAIRLDIERMVADGYRGTIGVICSFKEQQARMEEIFRKETSIYPDLVRNHRFAVWFVGDPELPLPVVNVSPGRVMMSCDVAPATSVSVPKLVEPPVTPVMVDVPDLVRSPDASGVPAVGLTRTSCHVSEFVTPLLLASVTVKVIWLVVTEVTATLVPLATLLILRELPPPPPTRVIRTVGSGVPVSNSNPDGTSRIIVPAPAFPLELSV